ncbi:MAG: class I SAM-dependent methyltransferase [Bryobacterales bacterium]|nr:class I SAM-dependent methyltransferase [Bryobacterales bacterium]
MSDPADHALEAVRPSKPEYGLDAPWLVRLLGGAGAGCFLLGVLIRLPESLFVLQLPLVLLQWAGLMGLGQAGLMFLSSSYGKLRARDRLIASISWRGDEQVLDVGCGRGLMLVAAARRLSTGRAVGIDNWRSDDLSDNWAEAAWDNARLEGVDDRIEIRDGDYRELPFEDASFDVVLASLAFYMLDNAGQRFSAMQELARVLKPGGVLLIMDIGLLSGHARLLREAGLTVKWEGFRGFMYPPTSVIRAVKGVAPSTT